MGLRPGQGGEIRIVAVIQASQRRRDHVPEGVLHMADGIESHQRVACEGVVRWSIFGARAMAFSVARVGSPSRRDVRVWRSSLKSI